MGAVFVSYRRGDSEGQARALSIELVELIGKDSVFMDVDSIALGRDFRQILQERLASCDLMLALIGPGWLDARDASGNRRLESSTDLVRQEIAAALKRNIPVTPVLLQGVQMPAPERLPDDIKDLSYRNGFELGHSTWESDVKEMVRRLGLHPNAGAALGTPGLGERQIAASAQASTKAEAHSTMPAASVPFNRPRLLAAVAAIAIAAGGAALLFYPKDQNHRPPGEATASPQQSTAAAEPRQNQPAVSPTSSPTPPSGGLAQPTSSQAASSDSGGGFASSGLELAWPGEDCWDIFRGEQLVTYQCGHKQQALQAGTYTIKAKHAPVFLPFEVAIKSGSSTRIDVGGTFVFNWPGEDCWDIFRGDQFVTYQCGAKKQALQAGSYTIKGKHAPVFLPYQVAIKSGSSTQSDLGGIFTFNWPGGDCWDIFRGDQFVTYQCGAKKQALQAGRYTIKGKHAPVFVPFDINVANGAQVKAP